MEPKLTKNQSMVLDALRKAEGPLTAYTILDRLRDEGFRAPPQVYRALDRLVEDGIVHRVESLNAFVACNHPDCGGHKTAAFTICNACGDVSEFSDAELSRHLAETTAAKGFALEQATIELRGLCAACHEH